MKNLLLSLAVCLFFAACQNTEKGAPKSGPDTAAITISSGLAVAPNLSQADSMQLIYYMNPYGKDSLRYTRFFTFVATADTLLASQIKQALEAPVASSLEKKKCRDEGKIFLFRKDGQELKTLYFAKEPRAGDCRALYFIHNGTFYYVPITEALTNTLAAYQKIAKEPTPKD
ncbi:MAG TPA: hypothetical protein PKD90_07920 [Phnomibacter sp.]|nr:hypothetical protein [Phnomibacter sp.]